MEDLASRIKYLQGLAEGLNLSEKSPEGRIILGVLEVLEDLQHRVEKMEERQREFGEFIDVFLQAGDEMEQFMSFLESNLENFPFDLEEDNDEEVINVECSSCGRNFYVDIDDVVHGSASCPSCGEPFDFADLSSVFFFGDDLDD